MQKLLIVCGPTATGKTGLGLSLAKKFNGEIVSADSRQVYKGMDIGTGKDLPKGANLKAPFWESVGYYEIEGVKVWGYDLVSPKKEFSVHLYEKAIQKILKQIGKREKLPIIVGGTGLYIKALVDGIPTASIPQNPSFRRSLEKKSPAELYDILAQFDSIKAASLNQSDRSNPRRLIRHLEIAEWQNRHKKANLNARACEFDTLFVGLSVAREILDPRIDKRVDVRLRSGFLEEIKKLLSQGVAWGSQAMDSLGYRQMKMYWEKKMSLEEAKSLWAKEEKAYVRRQMTWFKKDKRVNWFDISEANWRTKVVNLVQKWHNMGYAKEN
jgi:tRNA dimethylallyltransferase